ncbi:MAG TPA: integron integrase, partial [Vicinamibacteria bacterium]
MDDRTSPPVDPSPAPNRGEEPRLLDRVRLALRGRHYSPRTERAYVAWIRRYVVFHQKRHPAEMGAAEVAAFLTALATRGRVSASTQNQAFSALLFLYREVLRIPVSGLETVLRAKRPARVPMVLAREEVAAVLRHLRGAPWLMASLMYGSGLRLLECARLRIKDLDFARGEITVHDGKGRKDRVTLLPARLTEPLRAQIARTRRQHEADLAWGAGSVALPEALEKKYPSAPWEWPWQWVFPAARLYTDRGTGRRRRHHLHESVLQRAFREAMRTSG